MLYRMYVVQIVCCTHCMLYRMIHYRTYTFKHRHQGAVPTGIVLTFFFSLDNSILNSKMCASQKLAHQFLSGIRALTLHTTSGTNSGETFHGIIVLVFQILNRYNTWHGSAKYSCLCSCWDSNQPHYAAVSVKHISPLQLTDSGSTAFSFGTDASQYSYYTTRPLTSAPDVSNTYSI